MLVLEYLGYVALYGYVVFGLLYIISKFLPVEYLTPIDTIPEYVPLVETHNITLLDSIFTEYEIEQID